jgi:hypothetical protein
MKGPYRKGGPFLFLVIKPDVTNGLELRLGFFKLADKIPEGLSF